MLAVCALGLFVSSVAQAPELIALNKESSRLYNEWENSSYEDRSIFEAWHKVHDEELQTAATLTLLLLGGMLAQSFMASCIGISEKEKSEISDKDKEN